MVLATDKCLQVNFKIAQYLKIAQVAENLFAWI